MWKVRSELIESVTLSVDPGALNAGVIDELYSMLDSNRGKARVYFNVATPDGMVQIRARTLVIEPNDEVMKGIGRLLGRDAIQVDSRKT